MQAAPSHCTVLSITTCLESVQLKLRIRCCFTEDTGYYMTYYLFVNSNGAVMLICLMNMHLVFLPHKENSAK